MKRKNIGDYIPGEYVKYKPKEFFLKMKSGWNVWGEECWFCKSKGGKVIQISKDDMKLMTEVEAVGRIEAKSLSDDLYFIKVYVIKFEGKRIGWLKGTLEVTDEMLEPYLPCQKLKFHGR